ncbi:glycosyltransferase family 4 protein [Spirulina subsalsa FACHB-351]|uniref:Glycosyltransferase family 4 protein n=1 Tax=Spirulina subsalsa FACHB-351 TaxID=234711 RepID=A0ABT3L254_9CYAN|nr:glycosyltransferase family 4 protein [Spirulina subsalsa]MCW6035585.1 glycosyltransferase family 4 protein [Spirulina subsalsa FACHB-351]
MKILMLSATFPYPPTRGGTQVRTFNLLNYLRDRHSITLVTQNTPDVTPSEIEVLREKVAQLQVFPRLAPDAATGGLWGKIQRFTQFWREGTPPSVLAVFSPLMQAWITERVEQGLFDVITCEHSVNEIFVQPQWKNQVRTVVNIHSSVYATCQQQLNTQTADNPLRDRLNLPLLKKYEQKYCHKFSHLVATTPEDQASLQQLSPSSSISVIPNGVDLELFPPRSQDPGGQKLVFIGAMDNTPNIDAVCFFSREIFPQLRQKYPEITLDLVGARPVSSVQELSRIPGVNVTGKVPSMVDYLHQATICVVPMRTGFGIKNKTLEAMAAGIPVVGSDRGLEGLRVDETGVPLAALRANTIPEYISAVDRLLQDATLRAEISQNARQLIEENYTWEEAGRRYEQVLLGNR